MDRARVIASCAESEEDKVLLARVLERISQGDRRGIPVASCFLSPREQALAERVLRSSGLTDFRFFGGSEAAERCVCVYLPPWCGEDWLLGEDSPLAAFRASFYEKDTLSHRDFLGSLMGSGVKRETVGDIYVGTGSCDFLVLKEIAPYISQNLISAGRTKLSLSQIPLSELNVPAQETQTIQDTVAALRLDSIVASGFRMARGKASALIEAGKASLNHLPCLKPDKLVAENDVISLQGHGKLRLESIRGNTKKGRVAITLERYR